MHFSRRLKARTVRVIVPVMVLGAGVLAFAAPANADYVPPPAPATLASANPADHTPHVQNGEVRAFAQIGNTVYVGGSFTAVRQAGSSTWTTRRYLFAYDVTTGAIQTGFAPDLDNTVNALAVSPTGKLIVGGAFRNVNGEARRNLVALEPTSGATVANWVGRGDGGIVRRAVVVGNHLYIGGAFHWVNGTQHSLLARLNASTGAIDPTFQIDASGPRKPNGHELVWGMAVSPDGNTLVATGNFTNVNGLPRNQVVLVENLLTNPQVANWQTNRFVHGCYDWSFEYYAKDVDFSDDGSYFVIAADGGRGDAYCDSVSRWETSARGTNLVATWVDFTGTDSVTAVEATDGVVYAGGHFRWMNNANGNDQAGPGAVDRYGVAALDASNGLPLRWNPSRSGAPPGTTSWGPIVWEIWRGPTGIHFGYDSDGIGHEYHGRLALFPLSGGTSVPVVNAPMNTSGYLYLGTGSGQLAKFSFDGTNLGAPVAVSEPDLVGAGATFVVANKLYWSKTDAANPNGALHISMFTGGDVGAPWLGSGYNSWFQTGSLTGAFYLNGRMYYTRSGDNNLRYRFLGPDGYIVGCTQFTLPTTGINWGNVRGLTWMNGKIIYGSTDGSLRAVPFDETAASGVGVNGSQATVLATPSGGTTWNSRTLFFAAS
ncbi:MAG TPA: hypothetical protein VK028_05295 [Micromonosporaceae bacterium]|nr:hypothetical protein [Micromonosporaceae bacterium]